ncbi:MAG: Holliday junction resolvase Hjc [Candidatus Bathyarchaeia archaeon]
MPNRRGFKEERELVNRLEKLGFAVLRAPASGSGTKSDRPDILAGRRGLCIALEVKTTNRKVLYVSLESLDQLVRFSDKFGANPYLAVKFKRSGYSWLLLKPEDLKKSCKYYKITLEEAYRKGFPPEAILSAKLEEFGGN